MISTNPYDPPRTTTSRESIIGATGGSVLVPVVALTVWSVTLAVNFALVYIYRRTFVPAHFVAPLAIIGALQVFGTFVYAAVRIEKTRRRFYRLLLIVWMLNIVWVGLYWILQLKRSLKVTDIPK